MRGLHSLLWIVTGIGIASITAQTPPDSNKPKNPEDFAEEEKPHKFRMYLQSASALSRGLTNSEFARIGGPYVNLDADPEKIYKLANQTPFRISTIKDQNGDRRVHAENVHDAHPSKIHRESCPQNNNERHK